MTVGGEPHPNDQNGGEIPLTPRGAGTQTSDGFMTRTPFTKTVNGQQFTTPPQIRVGARFEF